MRFTFLIPAVLLAILALPAFAADSGYQTVTYMQSRDNGTISFKMGADYYVCSDAIEEHCVSILLTAIAADREVKAFYSTGTGSNVSPYLVTTLRTH